MRKLILALLLFALPAYAADTVLIDRADQTVPYDLTPVQAGAALGATALQPNGDGSLLTGITAGQVGAYATQAGVTLYPSSDNTKAQIELTKSGTPSGDRQGSTHFVYTRNGGTTGSAANWQEYVATAALTGGFDITSVNLMRSDNINGGTAGASWLVAATPNTNTGNWNVYGSEVNTFEAYADAGYNEDVKAAGKWTSGVWYVPEGQLNVGRGTERGYNGTYGVVFARSLGSDYGEGRTYPAAKWHIPLLVSTDATAPGGTSVLLDGGSTSPNAPDKGVKFKGYHGTGIDLSGATFAGSAIKVGATQTFTDGTVTKTLSELASGGYSLPTASTTVLGGVIVDGTSITIDGSGVISSTGGTATPGGAASSIQYNNAGSLGGFGAYSVTDEQLVLNSSTTLAAGNPSVILAGDNNTVRIATKSHASSPAPLFMGLAGKGTISSPTAVTANNILGGLSAAGWNGTAYGGTNAAVPAASAFISLNAAETHSTTAQGTYIDFQTTANGGTTRATKVRVGNNGNVLIGTTTDNGTDKLQVVGNVNASDGLKGTRAEIIKSTDDATLILGNDLTDKYLYFGYSYAGNFPFIQGGVWGGTTKPLYIQPGGGGVAIGSTTDPGDKTLQSVQFKDTAYAPSAGTSFTVDLANGMDQELTTNGNVTITLPAPVAGKSYTVTVKYGGTHTVTWAGGGTIKWAGGAAPTATSVNGKYDVYVFKSDATSTYTMGADGGRNY